MKKNLILLLASIALIIAFICFSFSFYTVNPGFRLFFVINSFNNPAAQLLALGLIIHIVLSTFINIGMVIGLLPIVGIPLPLVSYGISHLWITFASLGWFNSIAMRRFYMNSQT